MKKYYWLYLGIALLNTAIHASEMAPDEERIRPKERSYKRSYMQVDPATRNPLATIHEEPQAKKPELGKATPPTLELDFTPETAIQAIKPKPSLDMTKLSSIIDTLTISPLSAAPVSPAFIEKIPTDPYLAEIKRLQAQEPKSRKDRLARQRAILEVQLKMLETDREELLKKHAKQNERAKKDAFKLSKARHKTVADLYTYINTHHPSQTAEFKAEYESRLFLSNAICIATKIFPQKELDTLLFNVYDKPVKKKSVFETAQFHQVEADKLLQCIQQKKELTDALTVECEEESQLFYEIALDVAEKVLTPEEIHIFIRPIEQLEARCTEPNTTADDLRTHIQNIKKRLACPCLKTGAACKHCCI